MKNGNGNGRRQDAAPIMLVEVRPERFLVFVRVAAVSRLSPAAAKMLAPHQGELALTLLRNPSGQLGLASADEIAAEGLEPEQLTRSDVERFLEYLAGRFQLDRPLEADQMRWEAVQAERSTSGPSNERAACGEKRGGSRFSAAKSEAKVSRATRRAARTPRRRR